MTLICAIMAKGGIVVGSDSQVSINTAGGQIKHPINKIYRLGGNTLFAASGTIGLIQKAYSVLMRNSGELESGIGESSTERIKQELFPILRNAKESYVNFNGRAEGAPMMDMIVCGIKASGQRTIWHMSGDTHDEYIDAVKVWASGSAETVGYALMKSFISEGASLREAKLVMYRTLKESINIIGSGVSEPIFIASLCSDGAKILPNKELKRLAVTYGKWKGIEASWIKGKL